MARLEIVQTDAAQPYHLRLAGSNGEPVVISENYAERSSALSAIAVLAEAFGITMTRPPEVQDDPEVGELGVIGETPEGVVHVYPTYDVDEREDPA